MIAHSWGGLEEGKLDRGLIVNTKTQLYINNKF